MDQATWVNHRNTDISDCLASEKWKHDYDDDDDYDYDYCELNF